MSDMANMREPGRPWSLLQGSEYAGQLIIKGERQIGTRESDDAVVPVKAGNSAGGKGVTSVRP
jgi:hypothetical protein